MREAVPEPRRAQVPGRALVPERVPEQVLRRVRVLEPRPALVLPLVLRRALQQVLRPVLPLPGR